ncbi:ankyrin repeat domain-containing protein 26-like [Tupaia chinensis]|uniref:ankyrin repeat domain-containing protein 26-like n=1 Tax=Tupaia chinensis TaxID=246437 RepID=UPI000FFCB3A2|nr:ankyrin repeat domain-containing protein 26-like [Tupaia chinensis]
MVVETLEKTKSPPGRPLQLTEVKRFCETDSEEKSWNPIYWKNKGKKNEKKKWTSKTPMIVGTSEKATSTPGGPLQLTEVKRFCETDSEKSSSRKSNIDDSWPTSDDDFIGLDTKEASNPNLRRLAIAVWKYMENSKLSEIAYSCISC